MIRQVEHVIVIAKKTAVHGKQFIKAPKSEYYHHSKHKPKLND